MATFFAHNGVQALEKLKERPDIDIVVTDLNMPEMDGLTLLSELNQINLPFKTIVISGYGDLKNIRNAMNLGAFDFLTKPIDFQGSRNYPQQNAARGATVKRKPAFAAIRSVG